MKLRSYLMSLAFVFLFAGFIREAVAKTPLTQDWFVSRIRAANLKAMQNGADYFTRRACECLFEIDQKLAAEQLWQRRFDLLKSANGRAESYDLLTAALQMDRLDLANKVLAEADMQRDEMKDLISLHRYKKGNSEALKSYPHGKPVMTFYDAVDLGQVYIELGELEKLEALLSDLKITEENDPKDVAGILYKRIAKDARTAGDHDRAIKYIDKAYEVAGRQFYTGFTIRVTQSGIHGTIAKEFEDLAKTAQAYRGHQARELLFWLSSELTRVGEFELAEEVVLDKFSDHKDKNSAISTIGKNRADRRDYGGALAMARRLEDRIQKDSVRLSIAKAMLSDGKERGARQMVDLVRDKLEPAEENGNLKKQLAELEGMFGDQERLEQLLASEKNLYRQGLLLLKAMEGFHQKSGRRPNSETASE